MECIECGSPLPPRPAGKPGPRQKYCPTRRCRSAASDRRAKADGRFERWHEASRERTLKPRMTQVCRFCCTSFAAPRRRIRCDRDECRRAANAARTLPHVQRRRAATRGAAIGAVFTAESIFERDGWRCGICRRKVSRALRHPHPRSASLDHIVPLAAGRDNGGVHAPWNVQCAHLSCNLAKSATYSQGALV